MNKVFLKFFLLVFCFGLLTHMSEAQAKKRTVKKRTTAKRTTNTKTKASINPSAKVDSVAIVAAPKIDSLPIEVVKKSLRPNDAIERNLVKDRTP